MRRDHDTHDLHHRRVVSGKDARDMGRGYTTFGSVLFYNPGSAPSGVVRA
jgi:hypothetical protein